MLATGAVSGLPNSGTRRESALDGRRIAVLYREYRRSLYIRTVMLVRRD